MWFHPFYNLHYVNELQLHSFSSDVKSCIEYNDLSKTLLFNFFRMPFVPCTNNMLVNFCFPIECVKTLLVVSFLFDIVDEVFSLVLFQHWPLVVSLVTVQVVYVLINHQNDFQNVWKMKQSWYNCCFPLKKNTKPYSGPGLGTKVVAF